MLESSHRRRIVNQPHSKLIRFRTVLLFPMVAIGLALPTAQAASPYTPETLDPVKSQLNWRELHQLSSIRVHDILQTDEETFWITHQDGIIRLRGSTRSSHLEIPSDYDETSPVRTAPRHLFQSSEGELYCITRYKVLKLQGDHFEPFIDDGTIYSHGSPFLETPDGRLLVALGNGIYHIKSTGGELIYPYKNWISTIHLDQEQRLWLGTDDRVLMSYDFSNGEFPESDNDWERVDIPSDRKRWREICLLEGPKGDLWLHFADNGEAVYRKPLGSEQWSVVPTPPEIDKLALSEAIALSDGRLAFYAGWNLAIYDGESWVVTKKPGQDFTQPYGGLIETKQKTLLVYGNRERVFEVDPRGDRWLSYEHLAFQLETEEGHQWFLDHEGKPIRYLLDSNNWIRFDSPDESIEFAVSLLQDAKGNIWVSGKHEDTAALSRWDGSRWHRTLHPEIGFCFGYRSALLASDGTLYFANNRTWDPKGPIGGILQISPDSEDYESVYIRPGTVQNRINGMAETADGTLWLGGTNLSQFDGNRLIPASIRDMRLTWTEDLTTDSNGNLWAAHWGSGVFQKVGEEWIRHHRGNGLACNYGSSILATKDKIWVATPEGISVYDGSSWTTQTLPLEFYLRRGGTQLLEDPQGHIWINEFDHEWSDATPELAASTGPLLRTTRYTPSRFPPDTHIDFSTTDLVSPAVAKISWENVTDLRSAATGHTTFSWRINGGEWSPYSTATTHSFTLPDSGEYTFEVRARDSDFNVDPTPATAQISVAPPLFLRPWFITSCIIILITISGLIVLVVRQRMKYLMQLDEMHVNFFTNITHELRTPLTLILGPLETLKQEKLNSRSSGLVKLASRSARQLRSLVDQLLDFRRSEAIELKDPPVDADIFDCLQKLIEPHLHEADQKSLNFNYSLSQEAHLCRFPRDTLTKAVNNLLSNAIKYTPIGGTIELEANLANEPIPELILSVKDTGPGISKKEQQTLFYPFQRGSRSEVLQKTGTGLGLALTKQVIEAHDGSLQLDSPRFPDREENRGSVFTIRLPIFEPKIVENETIVSETPSEETRTLVEADSLGSKNEKPIVLVVEDNEEMRAFVKAELGKNFRIEEAENGVIGVIRARELLPDIVVSDVMMPEKDGYSLAQELKQDGLTCHIPIILLTALGSDDHHIEGFESGADSYIPKPFSSRVLIARIQNLIETYQRVLKLKTQSAQANGQPADSSQKRNVGALHPANQKFLDCVDTILENRFSDYSFDAEGLASELGLSLSSLHRKLKAIANQTPAALIREYRMEKAASMLQEGVYNVSEIVERVGYTDHSNFSATFRKRFGKSPKKYAMQSK